MLIPLRALVPVCVVVVLLIVRVKVSLGIRCS